MTEKVVPTCESCGARLPESADQCNLCGWMVGSKDHDVLVAGEEQKNKSKPASKKSDAESSSEEEGPFCYNCGWKNPAAANFCSSCGTRLQKVERKPVKKAKPPVPAVKKAPVEEEPEEAAATESVASTPRKTNGLHVAMMVLAGFMVVAVLYMITAFSKRAFPTTEDSPPQQAEAASEAPVSAPLSADMEQRIAVLSDEAAGLDGDEKVNKQREIVSLLMSVQRFDRAAPVQAEIAGETGTADDWFQTGHFYYDWMDQLSGQERFSVAQNAISAYEEGLAINPNDLNVRTALAMAYLNSQTPMLGVQQIRQVLDEDPDHLQGNFYFGVMLMQINRLEQSKAQFERVKELVDEGSPMYEQADIMLQNLESLTQ